VRQRLTLSLRRETLTELTAADLGSVAGGSLPQRTLVLRDCVRTLQQSELDCFTDPGTACVTG
jgi:hypothetical protein